MGQEPDLKPSADVPVGAEVYTEDGRDLGSVSEVRGPCFKVGLRWPFAYWLPLDAVDAAAPEQVTLLVPAAWLSDCRRSAPRSA
jgi:hypothetical protein